MLEAKVEELTTAIRDLITTIKAGVPATPAQLAAVASEAASTARSSKPKASPAPAAPADQPKSTTTYEQAAKAVTALIQRKGKPVALALLQKFGAQKLPEVKPERFAEVVAACEAEA